MRILFDFDGTLCVTPKDTDYDDVQALLARCEPRQRVLARVRELARLGHDLGIVTGRGPHVTEATRLQLAAWLGDVAADIAVKHRPRLIFSWDHFVDDKAQQILQLQGDVYVGDRPEDRAAALRAGARFVWDHDFEAQGLVGLRTVTA